MDAIDSMLKAVPLPPMTRLRQSFDRIRVADVAGELARRVRASEGYRSLRPGMRIAVTAGSRGVANLPLCIQTIVSLLREAGAEPFVVPAMGSHGGATARGQEEMLRGMGISGETVGAPVVSSMQTRLLCTLPNGLPVHMDENAAAADGIVVINRIKPHVSFRGPYESGLMKMITIGLGKQKGAEACHNRGMHRMAENIPLIANEVLARKNILFGVGLVENAFHETALIEVLERFEIPTREPALLEKARSLSPRLLFDSCDALVMDEIGKNISGAGFDTNAVGRYYSPVITGGPSITRVGILDLTDVSHGNANGMGLADFITRRLFDKFVPEQVYANALTSTVAESAKIPVILKNDRQVFQACVKTCHVDDPAQARLVRIKNTNELGVIEVSPAMARYVEGAPGLTSVDGAFRDLPFDGQGNLIRTGC